MDGLLDLRSRATQREPLFEIGPDGMSLDLLRAIYRNSSIDLPMRIRCAMACLPFESPKLAVTALIDDERDFGALLDRRIKHMEALGKNEVKMIESSAVEVKAPTPSINFRSLRRRI